MNKTILLLCFCLILQTVSLVTVHVARADVIDDEVVKKLTAFGILDEDDDILYEDNITKGKFAKYAAKICGYSFEGFITEPNFVDVKQENENYGSISFLSHIGVMNGDGNGYFNPDKNITGYESVKILVSILGYMENAERSGGYPIGYHIVASMLNITNQTMVLGDSPISTEEFLLLLMNTLKTDMNTITSIFSDESYKIGIVSNKRQSMLNSIFGIYEVNGVIEADKYVSIYGGSGLNSPEVAINGVIFEVGKTGASELLGFRVNGYYKESQETKVLLYISGEVRLNEVTNLFSWEISKVTDEYEVQYFFDEKIKTIKIEKSTTVIYNYDLTEISAEVIKPEYGYAVFIDNNSDGKIDLVKVFDYRIVVSDGISKSMIFDKLSGDPIEIEGDGKEYDIFVNKDGHSATIFDIAEGDVILYAESQNNRRNIKKLLVSSTKVFGMVEEKTDDDIVISGKKYETMPKNLTTKIHMEQGKFSLDYFGRIVYTDIVRDIVYGYLNNVVLTSGTDKAVHTRIFTENNRWVELKLRNKIIFNRSVITDEEYYNQYCTNADQYRQLITYLVNDEALITVINFAKEVEPWSADERRAIENDHFRLSRKLSSEVYRTNMNSFSNFIKLEPYTKIFQIPLQTADTNADTSDFSVITLGSLVRNRTYYNIYAYDADEFGRPRAVVLDYRPLVSNSGNVAVMSSMSSMLNDEGEITPSIRCYMAGNILSFPVKNESVLSGVSLKRGSILQFGMDINGKIDAVSTLYDAENGFEQKFIQGAVLSFATMIGGKILNADDSLLAIDYGSGKGIFSLGNANIYKVSKRGNEIMVTKETKKDLREGDNVFMRIVDYHIAEVVIFDN